MPKYKFESLRKPEWGSESISHVYVHQVGPVGRDFAVCRHPPSLLAERRRRSEALGRRSGFRHHGAPTRRVQHDARDGDASDARDGRRRRQSAKGAGGADPFLHHAATCGGTRSRRRAWEWRLFSVALVTSAAAPISTSHLHTSRCPFWQATNMGVHPASQRVALVTSAAAPA